MFLLLFKLLGKRISEKVPLDRVRYAILFLLGSVVVYSFIPINQVSGIVNLHSYVSGGDLQESVSDGNNITENDTVSDDYPEEKVVAVTDSVSQGDIVLPSDIKQDDIFSPVEEHATIVDDSEQTDQTNSAVLIGETLKDSDGTMELENDTITPKEDEMVIDNDMVSKNLDIIHVEVPTQGMIMLDPYNVLGMGQITSSEFKISNFSVFDVEVTLAYAEFELHKDNGNGIEKNCRLYWSSDDDNICLTPGISEDLELFYLKQGESRISRFTGTLSEDSENLWRSGDIKVSMVYRFLRAESEVSKEK